MANIAATLSLNVPAITALCKGEAGNTILNGTVNPTGVVGKEGDFFLNVATAQLFGPKTGGLWPPGIVLNNNALAPDWNSVYSSVRASSGSWNSAYTTSRTGSADWNNNYTTTRSNSANWNNTYTTVTNNSAVFTNVQNASANRDSVYTTVRTNSANWTNYDLGVRALTSNWQSTYTTVFNTSGSWGGGGGGGAGYDLGVRALTSFWDGTYTTVRTTSANWSSVYASTRSNSGNWDAVYSTVYSNSGGWEAGAGVASTVTTNSPYWDWAFTVGQAVTADRIQFTAASGGWDWAYNNTLTGTDDWNSSSSQVLSDFAYYGFTYAYQFWNFQSGVVQQNSNDWETAFIRTATWTVTGITPVYSDVPGGIAVVNNAFNLPDLGYSEATFGVTNGTVNSCITARIPSASTSWPNGVRYNFIQLGTGRVGVSGASGITINSINNAKQTNSQYTKASLVKVGTSNWVFYGTDLI